MDVKLALEQIEEQQYIAINENGIGAVVSPFAEGEYPDIDWDRLIKKFLDYEGDWTETVRAYLRAELPRHASRHTLYRILIDPEDAEYLDGWPTRNLAFERTAWEKRTYSLVLDEAYKAKLVAVFYLKKISSYLVTYVEGGRWVEKRFKDRGEASAYYDEKSKAE